MKVPIINQRITPSPALFSLLPLSPRLPPLSLLSPCSLLFLTPFLFPFFRLFVSLLPSPRSSTPHSSSYLSSLLRVLSSHPHPAVYLLRGLNIVPLIFSRKVSEIFDHLSSKKGKKEANFYFN